MSLVCRDPMLAETQMTSICREAYDKLMKLCAESGCSSNGHLGDVHVSRSISAGLSRHSCPWSPISSWIYPNLSRPPCDHACSQSHQLGISIAEIVARWPNVLSPQYHSVPFSTEFDVCVYDFMLTPWIRDHVCSAVALKCHGKTMTTAHLLRHIAVNMFYAVRDKTTGLSDLDVFKLLMHVHLRQLVATGYSRAEKLVFVEVIWAEASLM
ncbi:hypothetical protein BDN71DRAFT_1451733 [Pleurotus eryngii]|uniref:Uncharacterized protein n=1 Tax=Pleurotus eryngii TaxID=5323 RepID=A0A9P6DEB3_PLEER|nr:hypothetical protein BDN71DRAFT_1451733 [Pleurotus eryngii]